jgi:hypothetical protein
MCAPLTAPRADAGSPEVVVVGGPEIELRVDPALAPSVLLHWTQRWMHLPFPSVRSGCARVFVRCAGIGVIDRRISADGVCTIQAALATRSSPSDVAVF